MKGKEAGIGTVIVISTAELANLIFGGVAKADEFIVDHVVLDGTTPYATQIKFKYDTGAFEGKDVIDGEIPPFPIPDIQGSSDIGGVKHNLIAKPIDSITNTIFDYENNTDNIGGNEYWKFSINGFNGAGDWKNIFFSRYGKDANLADPNIVSLKTWDIQYMDGADWVQHGSFANQHSGTYDTTRFEPFNYADLNRDGLVNLIDFAILASRWKEEGIDKGSDPTVLSDYADIDGDREVNGTDLLAFSEYWLTDPNTITKAMQTLPQELYERLNETAKYILNHAGDSKFICRFYQNQVPGLPLTERLLAKKEDVENPLERSSNLRGALVLHQENLREKIKNTPNRYSAGKGPYQHA